MFGSTVTVLSYLPTKGLSRRLSTFPSFVAFFFSAILYQYCILLVSRRYPVLSFTPSLLKMGYLLLPQQHAFLQLHHARSA